jgi:AraC-like DNA-binding protein/tetratricopeptide (TPR) repeat protein
MIVSDIAKKKLIRQLTDIVLNNLENQHFGAKELSKASGMSTYSLSRKLKEITGKTASQFIRDVRLQKALEMIRTENLTISEIAYQTGFNSPTYFNTCFREFFGYPPGKVNDQNPEKTESETEEPVVAQKEQTAPGKKKKFLSLPVILVLAFVTVVVVNALYKKFHVPDWTDDLKSSDGRISIAVMPFDNMTNDTLWNIWQEGIQENLISALSYNKELKVRDKGSVNALLQVGGLTDYSALSPGMAGKISQKLIAGLFVRGSIQRAGNELRIDAQLTDAKTKEVIKSFITERPFNEENVLFCVDTLSKAVENYLLLSKTIKGIPGYQHYGIPSTNSPEAFRYNFWGDQAVGRFDSASAISWYLKALEADSNYFEPMVGLSSEYERIGNPEKGYEWVMRYYKKREQFGYEKQLVACWAHAFSFEPPEEAIKYLKRLQQMDDQSPGWYYLAGIVYNRMQLYDKAIPELQKNLEICRRWGKEFMKNNSAYAELGSAYHKTGQYKKEKQIYRLAKKYIPDDPLMFYRRAILALAEMDSAASKRYFEQYIVVHRKLFPTWEAEIPHTQACIYYETGFPDKAEVLYKKAIFMDPDNPERLFNLADFFIQYDRNLDEIQGLMDRAMALAHDKMHYFKYLDMKGWSLYKQGKNREALEILEKTWNAAPFPLYTIRSHLETVRKACGIKQPFQ